MTVCCEINVYLHIVSTQRGHLSITITTANIFQPVVKNNETKIIALLSFAPPSNKRKKIGTIHSKKHFFGFIKVEYYLY